MSEFSSGLVASLSSADYQILQSDITAIVTFIEDEKHLKLNGNKCSFMLICRKRSHTTAPPLFINTDCALEQVDSMKYLV